MNDTVSKIAAHVDNQQVLASLRRSGAHSVTLKREGQAHPDLLYLLEALAAEFYGFSAISVFGHPALANHRFIITALAAGTSLFVRLPSACSNQMIKSTDMPKGYRFGDQWIDFLDTDERLKIVISLWCSTGA